MWGRVTLQILCGEEPFFTYDVESLFTLGVIRCGEKSLFAFDGEESLFTFDVGSSPSSLLMWRGVTQFFCREE
jgi:hypothetical protein